MYSSDV